MTFSAVPSASWIGRQAGEGCLPTAREMCPTRCLPGYSRPAWRYMSRCWTPARGQRCPARSRLAPRQASRGRRVGGRGRDRERDPSLSIVIAAGNDHHLPRREVPLPNVGAVKAAATAQEIGGVVQRRAFAPTDTGTE